MDALFAQPTQPASAPGVRAFAELALNEIRSGVGGDASLLEDKQAFSEFMDRINESVLLSRREPPSAASVLKTTQDYSQEGEEGSADLHVPSPDSDVSMASPASSVQSVDMNTGSKTGPSTAVATYLEVLSSKLKLALSPRRHHRQRNDIADSGHAAQRQQPPQSRPRAHRVRFDVRNDACNEDEGLGTGARPPESLQYRKHGADGFVQQEEGLVREQNEDGDNEAPLLSSGDLVGPSLLQELRRWRSDATAEIILDRNRSPVPPPSKASISGRPSPHLSWDSLSSQLHDTPSTYLTAVHRGTDRVASTRGTLGVSERANHDNASAEPQEEFRAPAGRNWRGNDVDGGHNGVTRGGTGGHRQTTRRTKDSNNEPSPRGTTPRVVPGRAPRTLPASDRQRTGRRLSDGAEVTSAGRHWRDLDSNGHGKGRPTGGIEGFGGATRTTVEEGDQEKDDATELSLDLSDCSDEKLGAMLQRGRRVAS